MVAHVDTVKAFIKEVRKAKTLQDERSVVQKESAAIRASFREESGDQNVRSVSSIPVAPRWNTLPRCNRMSKLNRGARPRNAGETMSRSSYTSSRSVNGHTSARSNVSSYLPRRDSRISG